MGGRKKEKVFVYREDGSRYAEFDSEADFARHFDTDSNYMARERKELFGENIVKVFNSGLYACNKPIGRQRIKKYALKINSKYIKLRTDKDREIGCFNLNNDLIATFKGIFYLRALLGRDVNVLENEPKNMKVDIYFKYL